MAAMSNPMQARPPAPGRGRCLGGAGKGAALRRAVFGFAPWRRACQVVSAPGAALVSGRGPRGRPTVSGKQAGPGPDDQWRQRAPRHPTESQIASDGAGTVFHESEAQDNGADDEDDGVILSICDPGRWD